MLSAEFSTWFKVAILAVKVIILAFGVWLLRLQHKEGQRLDRQLKQLGYRKNGPWPWSEWVRK